MNRRRQTDTLLCTPSRFSGFFPTTYRFILPLLAFCWLAFPLSAKITNSVASGAWSAPGTWDNGVPADGDQITVSAAHTVSLTANVNFVLPASSLTVNGTLNLGAFTCRVTTTTVSANATVVQNSIAGLPAPINLMATTLSLHPASTYSYTGNQTGLTGIHPTYGHLSYASTSGSNGTLDVNLNVAGNFTINNPGAGEIRFGSSTNHSHTIGGNLSIAGGNAVGSAGTANVALDINGNFTIANTATFKACAAAGNLTVNLAGNYVQNGTISSPGAGIFNLILGGGASSTLGGAAALSLPLLTLSKTGGANAALAQHLTITKKLDFISGKLQTANFNLTLATAAPITNASGATGFVETNGTGRLIVTQVSPGATFPVGVGSFTPLSMVPTLSTSSFGVRVVDGFSAEIPGCNGFVTDDAVKKMWIVTRESGTALIMNMTLTWNGSDEGTTFNRTVCGIVQYLSGDWEVPVPNAATGSDPYQRGRLFANVFEGTFGVLDNSASVNLAAPTANSNSPLCEGDTLTLKRISAAVPGAVYQWSKQSGGFNPPAGPDATINGVALSDSGNYVLTLSKYGCNYTSTAVPVIVNALPVCAIGDETVVCTQTNGHVYSAPIGLASYAWTISGNGTISGPANGPQVTVNAGAPGSFTLSLTVTNSAGCTADCSLEVTVVPRPTGALSGSTIICAGESTELSIAVTGMGPWSGTLSDGTPFSGADSPILVNVSPANTTTYTLGTLSDAKCAATPNDLSGSATVTIDVLQVFQVTGDGGYCSGGDGAPVGLSGSETGVFYQLYLNGVETDDPEAGTGAAIDFGPQPGAGTYTVVATRGSTECTATMGGSVVVTINPLPIVSLVLGDDQASVSEPPVLLTGGTPGGGTYSGPGVAGGAINPFLAGLGAHVITYTVTDNNGCSNTATDLFTVMPDPGVNLLVEVPDSAECGEKFTVDIVEVTGFTDIGTLQFSVGWDLSVFMLMGTEATVLNNTAPLTGLIRDTLIYSWSDDNPPYGLTLPDDSLLLRLTFKPLKCDAGGKISIVGKPRVIEASNSGFGVVPVTVLNTHEITIQDTHPPVFTGAPANTSVSCDAVPQPGLATATDNCDTLVAVVYDGQTLANGSCAGQYTITRVWRATDDCNNSTTTTQVLQVFDTTPPTFTRPADVTLALDSTCNYDASLPFTGNATNLLDNCSPPDSLILTFTDVVAEGAGSMITITRTWHLVDDCGNDAPAQVQLIKIVDNTPPKITCPAGGSLISGNADCVYTVTGGILDPTASDNCGIEELAYTAGGAFNGSGPGTLDGVVLPVGTTVILWTVTDINGHTANCSFTVKVEDCAGISGKLIWEGDDVSGVAQATVFLSGDAIDSDGPTVADGLYTLIAGANGNFVVTPEKPAPPADPLNGVAANDALAIQNHLSGAIPITDPYKLIAADINLSNSVTQQDADLIRQVLKGSAYALEFFINNPWRFVPTPDPGPGFPGYNPPPNPFTAPIPESRVLTGVSGGATGQDFYGIKTGDVNASANPLLHPVSTDPLTLLVADQALETGAECTVVFTASAFGGLAGLQMALAFDPVRMQFLAAETGGSALGFATDDFGLYTVESGEIRAVWTYPAARDLHEGDRVFALRFKVLQGGVRLGEVLGLKPKALAPAAFTAALGSAGLQLVFTETTGTTLAPAEAAGVRLLQNKPNPFDGATTIGFVLPEPCPVQLRILDAMGREVFRQDKTGTAGYQEITVQVDHTAATGVLYYELTTPFGSLTRRMIATRR